MRQIALLVCLCLMAAACVTVDEGEAVVPVRFGEAMEPIVEPGLHYFNFITADAVSFPVRPQEVSFTSGGEEERGGLFGGGSTPTNAPISALSSEGGQVFVDLTLLTRVDGERVGEVYQRAGASWESVVSNIIVTTTRSVVRDCIPRFDFEQARTSRRGEAAQCILDGLENDLGPRGIIVEEVLIRDMRANEALQKSIEQRLEAQNAVREAEFLQQQARVDAETAVIKAEGAKQAAIVEAQGIAEANQLIADSLTPELLQLRVVQELGDSAVYFFGAGSSTVNPRIDLPVGQ